MANQEHIYTIKHRMQEILVVDYTGCTPAEAKDLSLAVRLFVTNQKKNSVLILGDFANIKVDRETAQTLKESTALDKPYVRRSAWININGFDATLKKSVQDFSTREFPVFPSREAALEYLTTDESPAAGKA